MENLNSLIQSILDIVKNKFQSRDTEYCIKFLCCSSNFGSAVRLKVMAKHKSNSQKKPDLKRKKESYAEPVIKKRILSDKHQNYERMDPVGKEIDGIIHWIPQKRKRFCLKEQNTINHWMVHAKKREQNGIVYEALKTRKKLLSDRAEWYNSLNPEGKENLSSD